MDERKVGKVDRMTFLPVVQTGTGCCTDSSCCDTSDTEASERQAVEKVLHVDLLVIDLETCARCVPTGDQLRTAVRLLAPAAEAMGIELRYRAMIMQTPEEAKEQALLTSPTIRLNGRDIAQDIRESLCESCGDLTDNDMIVNCREWHYRGRVYSAAPLPMLLEAIMDAILSIDQRPYVIPSALTELPENLRQYFHSRKITESSRCC